VALDLELTEALRAEGTARETIRAIQDARKAAGLRLQDGIEIGVAAGMDTMAAIAANREVVMAETLAVGLVEGEIEGFRRTVVVGGDDVVVTLRPTLDEGSEGRPSPAP